MQKIIFNLFFVFLSVSAFSQTLFQVNGEDVSVKEFERMYKKSNPDGDFSEESIKNYLELYIKYKLKLKEAEAKGYYKKPEVLREIAMYEEKLIQNEFDKEMMNELLAEVKTRMQEELCARHILIYLRRKPTPEDTLIAYNWSMRVRERLLNGASFEKQAKKESADIDTKFNGGDLGCFTALQLSSYDLENALYNMRKGEISMPIRTKAGYHLIQLDDRRPTKGLVKASQLFVRANKTQKEEQNQEAKILIHQAYAKLNSGEKFNDVSADFLLQENEALEVSKDAIDWFSVGSYESAFENGIFSLEKVGDYSAPIQTSLGWHIFKLDGQKELPKFEKIESNLRDLIKEDERYFKSKMRYSERLKQKYSFVKNQENINLFIKQVARGIDIKGWQIPTIYDLNSDFFTIDSSRVYTAQQFVNYVKEQHHQDIYHSFEHYYSNFESNSLLQYHKENMVKKSPELNALMKEYHDGIILFNLMEKELWSNKKVNDTDVKTYYKENKKVYKKPDQVKVRVYKLPISESKKVKKLVKYLKANKGEYMIRKLNEPYKTIDISDEYLTVEDASQIGITPTKIGSYGRKNGGDYVTFYKNERFQPGGLLDYSKVKSKVILDYQKKKEENWVSTLKKKYKVEINEQILSGLYK